MTTTPPLPRDTHTFTTTTTTEPQISTAHQQLCHALPYVFHSRPLLLWAASLFWYGKLQPAKIPTSMLSFVHVFTPSAAVHLDLPRDAGRQVRQGVRVLQTLLQQVARQFEPRQVGATTQPTHI